MSNVLGTVTPVKEIVRSRMHAACRSWSTARRARCMRRRCARSRRRFLCRDRPQALWADRHRRAVRQEGMAVETAALQRRRRNDREVTRRRDLWRSAAAFRGRHAADHRGDRTGAALDYMNAFGRVAIHAHEPDLGAYARAAPGRIPICGCSEPRRARARSFAFEMKGAHAHDVATIIDRSGVAVRAGTIARSRCWRVSA